MATAARFGPFVAALLAEVALQLSGYQSTPLAVVFASLAILFLAWPAGHVLSQRRIEKRRQRSLVAPLRHREGCPADPVRVERYTDERPDGIEVDVLHCLDCGAMHYSHGDLPKGEGERPALEAPAREREPEPQADELRELRALYAQGEDAVRFHERVAAASANQRIGRPAGPGPEWAQRLYEHLKQTRPERLRAFETEIEDALIDRPPRNITTDIPPEKLIEDRVVEALRHKLHALGDLIEELSTQPLAEPRRAWTPPPYTPPPEAAEAKALIEKMLPLRGLLAELDDNNDARTNFPYSPTYKRLQRLLERAEDVLHRAPTQRLAVTILTDGISDFDRAVSALHTALKQLSEVAAMQHAPGRFDRIADLNQQADALLTVMAAARRGERVSGGLEGHRDRLARWMTWADGALQEAGADSAQLAYFNQDTDMTLHGPSGDENEQIGQFMDDLKLRRARMQEIVGELRALG